MADQKSIEKVQNLSDLELAALICLITHEHCIIDTEPDALEELVEELELIARKIYGLSTAVVDCSEYTTLDDFAQAIISVENTPPDTPVRGRTDGYFLNTPGFKSTQRSNADGHGDNLSVANVIIAKNLDDAPVSVQIQALELMRTKRIYTRSAVHQAPKRFVLFALLGGGEGPRLTKHLNDFMFISHFHDPEDGYANVEELYDEGNSISSVVRNGQATRVAISNIDPVISASYIEHLSALASNAKVSVEVTQYQQNIIAFLRIHRAVAGGITASATKHFSKLVKCLAPLHDLTFATPSLVALAARKIYTHRILIVDPERERSMQWGSDIEAVEALLDGVGPEDVIEEVLGTAGAEAPL